MIDATQLDSTLRKYARHGPRYTSYPTALHFSDQFGINDHLAQIAKSNQALLPKPLSIYVHIPFCASLCYYCGCNKVVTRNKSRAAEYVELISHEIAMTAPLYTDDRLVQQLHFGGGTPTFMSTQQINEVLEMIAQAFHLGLPQNLEMSIEIDPRSVTVDELDALIDLGFNRFSLGIQDVHEDVQKAVNREQSIEKIEQLLCKMRERNVNSVSFDLIYGLPRQSRERFARTLDTVIGLKPDRIALYNYAHMPDRMPAQRLINTSELPNSAEKLGILSDSIRRLCNVGYIHIGMDHFALPGDSLTRALENGSLQRNFQGYSTKANADLIGIGVSAISKIGESFRQNEPNLSAYEAALLEGRHPMAKGLLLGRDDSIRASIIQRIMCGQPLVYEEISCEYDVDFEAYFKTEIEMLSLFEEDDLIRVFKGGFDITPLGRTLLRNIAMVFDGYLQDPSIQSLREPRYSQTV